MNQCTTLQGDLARKGFTQLAGPQQGKGRERVQLLKHNPLQPPEHLTQIGHATAQIRIKLPALQR